MFHGYSGSTVVRSELHVAESSVRSDHCKGLRLVQMVTDPGTASVVAKTISLHVPLYSEYEIVTVFFKSKGSPDV